MAFNAEATEEEHRGHGELKGRPASEGGRYNKTEECS
jgi:hypothetical protein